MSEGEKFVGEEECLVSDAWDGTIVMASRGSESGEAGVERDEEGGE